MVTRNETPENAPSNDKPAPSFNMQGVRQELWSATDSDTDGENIWGDARQAQDASSAAAQSAPRTVPDSLRPGTATQNPFDNDAGNPWNEDDGQGSVPPPPGPKGGLEHVPTVLRPGGRQETNPFKRKPLSSTNTGQSATKSAPDDPPPAPPTNAFSQLQLNEPEQSTNPWKPAVEEPKSSLAPPPVNSIPDQDSGNNVWGSGAPSRQPSPNPRAHSPAIVSLPSEGESSAWDDDIVAKPSLGHMPHKSLEEQEFSQDSHAWDDLAQLDKGRAPAVHVGQTQPRSGDDWNLIDHDPQPVSLSRQSTWENFDEPEPENNQAKAEQQVHKPPTPTVEAADVPAPAPALPPRTSEDVPPPQPPRAQSPSAQNKNETYQIKNINWHDVSAAQNPRKSPILVQNANGPCPLVALVNALTLTTPADLTNTVLVETLRSREQISLNLLLEAVFDELMSPRRTKSDVALPDVSELYAFLKGLQTGMNVNPRYIPTPELINAHKRTSLTHVHPSERGDLIPGTFEDTRDMKLYATFSIPLIHGWLPPKDDPVYEAFHRQASSYDDVQSLLFREEELEDKLSAPSSAGLTEQEQQMYQDIMNIKTFLATSATQLTPWGLDVITKSVRPGAFSILFRNDHFSTLYRHPQTLQLLVLVTDAGYHSHDEVVWESLADVNGERAEFFSGDFRLVGGPQDQQSHQETAQASNSGSRGRRSTSEADDVPVSPTLEQEDRDLALALQLQEEEDERHRNEQAARQRERQLSEQFIEQQGRGNARTGPPRPRGGNSAASSRGASTSQLNIPPRASSNSLNSPVRGTRPAQQQPVRPLVPPANNRTHRPADGEDEDAPPSYEQASKATPYVPPAGHPSHPESSPGSSGRGRRGNLAGGPSRVSLAGSSNGGRGRPPPVAAQSADDRHKDCAIM